MGLNPLIGFHRLSPGLTRDLRVKVETQVIEQVFDEPHETGPGMRLGLRQDSQDTTEAQLNYSPTGDMRGTSPEISQSTKNSKIQNAGQMSTAPDAGRRG
jgi:hypothetical protein